MSRVYKVLVPGKELTQEFGPMFSLVDAIRLCEQYNWSTDCILTAEETETYSEWKKAMPE